MTTSESNVGQFAVGRGVDGQSNVSLAASLHGDVPVMTDIYREMFFEIAARSATKGLEDLIEVFATEAGLLTIDYARFCSDQEGYGRAELAGLAALGVRLAGGTKPKLSVVKGGRA
jgi:hypothetical protein